MNVLILYAHLAVVVVISAMFLNALKGDWARILCGFIGASALLTAYGYAIWSLVRMVVR